MKEVFLYVEGVELYYLMTPRLKRPFWCHETQLTFLALCCRLPNQTQGPKAVSLVTADSHFDPPTNGCVGIFR